MINCLFITLGCAKNEVDTDRMRAILARNGMGECTDLNSADVVIINTCSFLAAATQESIETTLEIAEAMHEGVRSFPIIMCGCVPSRYGASIEEELPEVAAFVPAEDEDTIADVVQSVLDAGAIARVDVQDDVLRTVQGASSFVKISDGCDRYCAFCAIPYIRGRYRSRSSQEICDEVLMLASNGVREVVLIGQDTGVWGRDLPGKPDLADLLQDVALVMRPYKGWVRVLYLQPEGMTERLISAMRELPEVLPYIDIPIQHCNHRVLRSMNRRGSNEELRALFDHLRAEIPNMVLRTTGLVGFPGETEQEADELLDFIQDVGFDYTSVFAYSQEDGTVAAAMDQQIDESTKLERAQRLTDVAEQLGFASTASHVGEVVDVIIDGVDNDGENTELIGHTWFQAPDSDGAVHIDSGDVAVGQIVRCRLVDSFCYELIGELVESY